MKHTCCVILAVALLLTGPGHLFARRIVSTSPAITEIIFALKSGKQIVGATSFCDYPPAALNIPRIGGFIDLNLEKVVSLRPDWIVHYPESKKKLEVLGTRSRLLEVRHQTLRDLYDSIHSIAGMLQVERKGRELVADIQSQLQQLRMECRGHRIRLLLVAGHVPGETGRLTLMGRGNFLDEILELLGGENAYRGKIPYPIISREALTEMDPHGIIDLSAMNIHTDRLRLRREWERLPAPFRPRGVLVVTDPVWLRPGPRIVETARALSRFIRSLGKEENR